MKAAIISLQSTSSKWTAEAMRKYFETVDDLNLKFIEVNIAAQSEVLYQGKPLPQYDCIYVKGSFRYASILRSVTDILSATNTFMPLSGTAFTTGHDKLLTHLRLARYNVPMPRTYISSTTKAAKEVLQKITFPIIMKIPHGTQGKGVMFAESFAAASSMLDTLDALKQPFIIQEYIETGGTDIRAVVIGDKVVASMQRISQSDEKRSNIHAGGSGEPVELDQKTQKIAIDAARAVGASICGVDILKSVKGPLVIEVNLSPGLQGITKATNKNIADAIAKYLADNTKRMLEHGKKDEASKILDTLGISATAVNKVKQTEISKQTSPKENCIVTNIDFRGSRLLLPEIVTKLSQLTEKQEVTITIQSGKVLIELNE